MHFAAEGDHVVLTEGVDVDVSHENHVLLGVLVEDAFSHDVAYGVAVPAGEEL